MSKALDLTGKVFGRLLVLNREGNNKNQQSIWLCKCECGNLKSIHGSSIKNGETKSCGCLQKEALRERSLTHGGTIGRTCSKTYNTYRGMKSRCYREKDTRFYSYGAKGIKVCDRWLESFENFLEDMGERPEGLTIERKDPTKNYEPSNCIWGDITEQNFNIGIKSNNKTGRTGVKKSGNGQKWIAFISKSCIKYHLGTYDSYEEAAEIRGLAELELYGFTKR